MSKRLFILQHAILFLLHSFTYTILAQIDDIPIEFKNRRSQVMSRMDTNSVAILRAADEKSRSFDVNFPFRQESNFIYLTGYQQSRALLILVPGGFQLGKKNVREIFFSPSNRNIYETSEENIIPVTTVYDTMLSMEHLEPILKQILTDKEILYYSLPNPAFYYDPVSGKRLFIEKEIRKELTHKYPKLKIRSIDRILSELRMVKSTQEIINLQKAIDITSAALRETIRSAEPGMYEYQLQAILEYIFRREGASGSAFSCIIGSGPNSLILHYDLNQRQMRDGDMVVMDVGAEYQGYSADITRTIPINGKFTATQRELYELVLHSQREALKFMKPGGTRESVEVKVREIVTQGLIQLGIMKEKKELSKFLPHGVCHSIGLDTHDGTPDKLVPGMIITLEPGIYVPAGDETVPSKYWNIGIRIEDDILITTDGHRVMSTTVPKEISEIEKMMKASGIGNDQKIGR